jgi:hypothetical protein
MSTATSAPARYRWNDAGWRGQPWHEVVAIELAPSSATQVLAARRLPGLVEAGFGAIALRRVSALAPLALSEFVDRAHAAGLMIVQPEGAEAVAGADFHLDGVVVADDLPSGVFGDDDAALRRLVAAWVRTGRQPYAMQDMASHASPAVGSADAAADADAGSGEVASRQLRALRWPMAAADPPWRDAWDACALLSPPVPLIVGDAHEDVFDPARWRSLIGLRRRELAPRIARGHGRGSWRVDGGLIRIEWPLGDASSWHVVVNMSAAAVTTGAMPAGWTVHSSRTRPAALPGEIELDPGGFFVAAVEPGV